MRVRVALLNTVAPYIRGGAEIAVDSLNHHLQIHGHDSTIFRVPFPYDFGEPLMSTHLSIRTLRFDHYDRVIAFKFPAYCAQHPRRVMWMFHQFRQVYDLWGKDGGFQPDPVGIAVRTLVKMADDTEIPKSRHVYVNAQEVANRLLEHNNIHCEVLPPPVHDETVYYCGGQDDYIYYPSRVTSLKRQHLAIEAMKYVKSGVRLMVTGQCPEPNFLAIIRDTICKNNLEKKVIFRNEWIDEEEKIKLLANSLGVIYIPLLEDSCGYVTMEGFYSRKPVITCYDSGGTKELVENSRTGFISEPTPQKLAEAMDLLYEDKTKAEKMGQAAFEEITQRELTWEHTINKLLL